MGPNQEAVVYHLMSQRTLWKNRTLWKIFRVILSRVSPSPYFRVPIPILILARSEIRVRFRVRFFTGLNIETDSDSDSESRVERLGISSLRLHIPL